MRRIFATITELQNEKSSVEIVLSEKEKELDGLKKQELKVAMELKERREEVTALSKGLQKSREETSEAIETSKNRNDEVMKLRGAVEEEQKARDECQEEAKKTQAELTETKKKLEVTSLELASLKDLALPLKTAVGESTSIKGKLDTIFSDVYRLAGRFFSELKLADDAFQGIPWENLTKDDRLAGIPLPPSNTPPARYMRRAAVIRLIALAAVRHLFQPVYLTEEGGELGEALDEVHVLDPRRAHWVRSILLKIDTNEQSKNGKRRAEAVVRDVLQSVGALLVSSDGSQAKVHEFRDVLYRWCEKTLNVWQELQLLEPKFTALFIDDAKSLRSEDWTRLPDSPTLLAQGGAPTNGAGPRTEPKGGLISNEIVAKLWPAFLVSRAKDGVTRRFKSGYVLVEPQVSTARKEVANVRLSYNSSHRRLRSTQRRLEALIDGQSVRVDQTLDWPPRWG
ncbi:hypothetical protein VPNG_07068 [Cytospora leucostoma]|uniref:Uncharacterized protein n=1 Tax=Cytospora leucostoma TaxID=1230097 RepID=A0A423WVP1_9PEZI|nr:hypothetical protein VPNG_07068 [Cytospora leucostoma]